MVRKAIDGKVAAEEVQGVYRELERDDSIRGVGATTRPGERPRDVVPRSQFPERSGLSEVIETSAEARSRKSRERVTLISPVLLEGPRRWRFSFHEGEFGAPIKDEAFVHGLLNGRPALTMTSGIEMDVLLETKEEKIDGVWTVTERNVLKVYGTTRTPRQRLLPLGSPKKRDSNRKKDK